MPGYKAATAQYQTVSLDGGYTATIQKLRKDDQDACQAVLMGEVRSHTEQSPGAEAKTVVDQAVDNAAYTTELLVRGISQWTLDDENGAPLPITRQTVQELTAADAGKLVVAIAVLSAGIDPQSASAGSSGAS